MAEAGNRISSLLWRKSEEGMGSIRPNPRTGHTLTLVDKHYDSRVYLFGGRDVSSGKHSNELFSLEVGNLHPPRTGRWIWSTVTAKSQHGKLPEGREGHSATAFRKFLVFFGGLGREGLKNDVFTFDLDSLEWSTPPLTGELPIRRYHHSSCTFGREWVHFGGYSEYGDCEDDTFVLNMDKWKWYKPRVSGKPPSRRMSHSASRFGRSMLVFGGFSVSDGQDDSCYLCDVHVLSIDKWTWSSPKIGNAVPNSLPRGGHCAQRVDNQLLVLGGKSSFLQESCDVWLLDTVSWTWSKPAAYSEMPNAICGNIHGHDLVLFGAPYCKDRPTDTSHLSRPKLILWGGEQDKLSSQIFLLDIQDFEFDQQPDKILPEFTILGNAVVPRPYLPPYRNWQMIDTTLTVPRNSLIVKWQLWANDMGTIRMQVYRPVPREGLAAAMKHPYRLVGENVLTARTRGLLSFDVPEHEQVEAQTGDLLGIRVDSDVALGGQWPHKLAAGQRVDKLGHAATPSGVVAIDYGGIRESSNPEAAGAGNLCRYCVHDYLGVGKILNFDDNNRSNLVNMPIPTFLSISAAAFIVPLLDQSPAPQDEVEEQEKEPGLKHIIEDPTLPPLQKKALTELMEQRLLETMTSTSLSTTRRKNKQQAGANALSSSKTAAGQASPSKLDRSRGPSETNDSLNETKSSRSRFPSPLIYLLLVPVPFISLHSPQHALTLRQDSQQQQEDEQDQ